MNSVRMTGWLAVLVILCAITSALAWSRALASREGAILAQSQLSQVHRDLRDLGPAPSSASAASAPATSPASIESDVNRLIRNAAAKAGAADALSGIEAGHMVDPTVSSAPPIVLRFEPLTMKQLVTFLHEVSISDRRIHSDAIELSAAPNASENPTSERWTTTVTLVLRPASVSGR